MSTSTFDPATISITAAAQAHIAAQIVRSGHRHLRLGVTESGCNGFMYKLDFIDAPEKDDQRFDIGDIEIYVSRQDLPMVLGTEVDYVVEGLNASLKFKNPHAASYCGCGESFSVEAAG